LFREVESDSDIHPGDGADRNGDLLATPQVSLLEKYVGHPVIAGADEEALHPPDLTIDGVYRVTRLHIRLTQGSDVFKDRRVHNVGTRGPVQQRALLEELSALDRVVFRGVREISPAVDTTSCTGTSRPAAC
jgi:hypothetical protein